MSRPMVCVTRATRAVPILYRRRSRDEGSRVTSDVIAWHRERKLNARGGGRKAAADDRQQNGHPQWGLMPTFPTRFHA
jgi:hypothetical protein